MIINRNTAVLPGTIKEDVLNMPIGTVYNIVFFWYARAIIIPILEPATSTTINTFFEVLSMLSVEKV